MLGQLHMDVFQQRLADDYKQDIIVTAPSVTYKILYKDGSEVLISNPSDFPSHQDRESILDMQEPMVMATIIVCVPGLTINSPDSHFTDSSRISGRHQQSLRQQPRSAGLHTVHYPRKAPAEIQAPSQRNR